MMCHKGSATLFIKGRAFSFITFNAAAVMPLRRTPEPPLARASWPWRNIRSVACQPRQASVMDTPCRIIVNVEKGSIVSCFFIDSGVASVEQDLQRRLGPHLQVFRYSQGMSEGR